MSTTQAQTRQPRTTSRNGADKALRKSELRYRRLFESAQNGILILEAETGTIIDANPFILRLLDYPFEELFGRHLWEIGEFKDAAASQSAFSVLQSTEYVRYENLPLLTRNGDRRDVEFISNVYDVEGEKVVQCNIREISARAEVEQAARSHLAGLEFASKAKDSVLAIVSHELRTPLAAISSMLDLIEAGYDLPAAIKVPEDVGAFDKSALAYIRRNIRFLSSVTDQLFDITYLSKGTIYLEPEVIDAHRAISEVLQDLELRYTAKQISIEMQLHAWEHHLLADICKFRQILSNLIGNAIKFTPIGGAIDIVTYNAAAGQITILVHDNGIGLEGKDITRIFSPYEQADASIRLQYGGLGLGLSIARSLVDAHGGKLTAESAGKDRGTTFILELKSTVGRQSTAPSFRASSPTKPTPLRILVVEDNVDARDCLTRLLRLRGHFVSSAATVQETLNLTTDQKFDLLITDIQLPDGNGWDLLQTLTARLPNLEGIAISGYDLPPDIPESRKTGFAEYLLKPVTLQTLEAAVAKALDPDQRRGLAKEPFLTL
jgi:PAS domain S-box-containing protein